MKRTVNRVGILVATAALSLGLVACSGNEAGTEANGASTSATAAAEVHKFENCGHSMEIDGVPQKVMLVNRVGVAPTLDALGVLDHVHMVAGPFPEEYFSPELAKKMAAIPLLTDKVDAGGHLQISKEEIVATDSDLIIGYAGNVDYNAMQGTGVPIIEEPGFCGALNGAASWDHVWDHIKFYGDLFDASEAAEKFTAETKARLEAAEAKKAGEGLRVAVLYPATDGSVNYAYGAGSMSNPIVESAGMINVFGDSADRVFEVSDEELIARNPDVIISLHSKGGDEAAAASIEGVKQIKGINDTNAGKNGAIMPMLLYLAEPPSGMSIDGLEQLNEFLEQR